MEDYNFLWYILAAIIYIISRSRKKKQAPNSRPGSENAPPPERKPVSFEELLREVTGEGEPEPAPEPVQRRQTPVETKERESQRLEGKRRAFADEESKRIYEESIKKAEGADIDYKRDEHFRLSSSFQEQEEEEYTFADEIRDGIAADPTKAIIYNEILSRKY